MRRFVVLGRHQGIKSWSTLGFSCSGRGRSWRKGGTFSGGGPQLMWCFALAENEERYLALSNHAAKLLVSRPSLFESSLKLGKSLTGIYGGHAAAWHARCLLEIRVPVTHFLPFLNLDDVR